VSISNASGSVASNTATVTVLDAPPSITDQPASTSIASGTSALLTVVGTGTNLSYQWYAGSTGNTGTPIDGATASTYLTPTLIASAGYWVQISNSGGAIDSNTCIVTVIAPPTINSQPVDTTIEYNTQGSLSVGTASTGVTYQWYEGVSGDTSAPVTGATTSTLTTPTLIATTQYWVMLTNISGSINSDAATVTVNPAVLITTQPVNSAITAGGSTLLTVGASGVALSYQWYEGASGDTSVQVSGGNSSFLVTPPHATDTSYWVQVFNSNGSEDSVAATVTVVGPVITSQPADTSTTPGGQVTLSVSSNPAGDSFQWYEGTSGDTSNPIGGETSSSFTTPALLATTSYWVSVTTIVTTNSNTATVSVIP